MLFKINFPNILPGYAQSAQELTEPQMFINLSHEVYTRPSVQTSVPGPMSQVILSLTSLIDLETLIISGLTISKFIKYVNPSLEIDDRTKSNAGKILPTEVQQSVNESLKNFIEET